MVVRIEKKNTGLKEIAIQTWTGISIETWTKILNATMIVVVVYAAVVVAAGFVPSSVAGVAAVVFVSSAVVVTAVVSCYILKMNETSESFDPDVLLLLRSKPLAVPASST
ncbi:hypothetical protein [Brevibacillus antibioticus]|uniref:hypothetical protein n=1 Tax=Brevibacillus antibioticus TaxID=2570228 RepID=UPI001390215B|nr:hypothetical protein [Brevibacillus antibioticus]